MKNQIFLVSLSLLLSACANLEVVTPNPRVESPETRGEAYKFKVGLNTIPAHEFEVTGNAGARPPDLTTDQELRKMMDIGPMGSFTVFSPLEVGAEIYGLGHGGGLFTKWQILGEGTDKAEKGDFALGIYARGGAVRGEDSGDQSTTFGAGGYHYDGKLTNYFAHAGISVGVRVDPHVLIYAGGAYGEYWAQTKIEQDEKTSGTPSPGGVYKQTDRGYGRTLGFGVQGNFKYITFYAGGEHCWIDYEKDRMSRDDFYGHVGARYTP